MRSGLVAAAMIAFATAGAIADERSDIDALRDLDQAYATAWLAGDPDVVMALFTEDATLVPHHGDPPVKGRAAIRSFWFDPAYPPVRVDESHREPAEVFVEGDTGVVRGRSRLTWVYEGVRTTIPEGNYVLVAKRTAAGWRIRLLTWNDDPRDWLEEPASP